ncbi:MAG: tRNA pseudouridine(55) synthase TruB [Ruminococcaceae bacterium]|nr:tRNA pseudouridine(55) synthase TruB [Oscillospiraceae bacterium]
MNGIICINKPKDITSFGVVAKVRGITRQKKVGHTGTLDPMATGVLPVMLGTATRFLNFLPESDKGYRASFITGKTTDTLDITGEVVSVCDMKVTNESVAAILSEFTGKILQTPPMYSAKSVDGVRLYELARQGIEVERKPCEVKIKKLELVGEKDGEFTIDVICSKGTYIRSLIDDIGKKLGCGAVMTSLCRTLACGFTLDDCTTLEELQNRRDGKFGFDDLITGVETILSPYKKVAVSPAQAVRFSNGGALDTLRIKTKIQPDEICTVYSPNGDFLGLGQNKNNELKALRLLPKNQ